MANHPHAENYFFGLHVSLYRIVCIWLGPCGVGLLFGDLSIAVMIYGHWYLVPDAWYLVQGTFLPPNGSRSNITGSYFGYPGLMRFRVCFDFRKSGNYVILTRAASSEKSRRQPQAHGTIFIKVNARHTTKTP